jgi:hypothetical protein
MSGGKEGPRGFIGLTLDRRTFLGGAGLAAGSLMAAALVPLSLRGEPTVGPVLTVAHPGSTWHVDDMWGHSPRYAHPIPYAGVQGETMAWEHVDPIDRMFVC